MVIWKFPLAKLRGSQAVKMPRGARALSVQVQRGRPVLWALVDPKEPLQDRIVLAVMTGEDRSARIENWTFVGTFQLYDGDYVGHVFIAAGLD